MLPSGPVAMPYGPLLAVGRANSVVAPEVVIRPIVLLLSAVNQRLPSCPAAMPPADTVLPPAMPPANSVMAPEVVIRPILPLSSVNQRLPSGPAAMPNGLLAKPGRDGMANSV